MVCQEYFQLSFFMRKEGVLMGRPAKSIAMKTGLMTKEEINKRLEGEARLKGKADKLKAPSYLSKEQKAIFNYIMKNLEQSGILGNLDVYVLGQTAITIHRIQECEIAINEQGLFDEYGKPNQAVKVKDSYMKEFFKLCNELSLSPQARAKLSNINFQSEQDASDPLTMILGGGQ